MKETQVLDTDTPKRPPPPPPKVSQSQTSSYMAVVYPSTYHIACKNGDYGLLVSLLETRQAEDLNGQDSYGYTALHHAASCGYDNMVELLLSYNAAVDKRAIKGLSALHCAAYSGHAEVIRLLLSRVNDVNERDYANRTALHWAAERGHLAAVEALLENELVEVNPLDIAGLTPFVYASYWNHYDVVSVLRDAGGKITVHDSLFPVRDVTA